MRQVEYDPGVYRSINGTGRMKKYIRSLLVSTYVLSTFAAGFQVTHAASNVCVAADAPGCTSGLPTFQYEALLGEMAANPVPDVQPLSPDTTELGTDSFFRVVGGTAPIYDAPNGKPIGAVNSSFYSVNVIAWQGDWAELDGKRWLHADELTNAASSPFAGVLINAVLPYPFAWVMVPTRPSPVPGGTPDASTPMLERYQRVNIFATVTVGDWDWLLIGPGQWIEQRRVARVLPTPRPDGVKGRWIAVDLYEQVLVAYEGDRMVYATLVSTGIPKPGFGTNKGLFHIWAHLKQDNMSGDMGGTDA